MSVALLLFDLDETVAPDEEVNAIVFREAVSAALASGDADVERLRARFDAHIEHLWQQGPAAAYCARLGISAWEGLWGPFGPSEHPMLGVLHTWVPEYRKAAWQRLVRDSGSRDTGLPHELEARFSRERRARQRAYPWSAGVLERLAARYRLGMITNGAPDLQRLKLAGTGLAARFEPLVVSGDLDVGKPERAIFEHALRLAGVAASDTVMVGDSWERDMRGALGVGMPGIWITRQRAPLPDVTRGAQVRPIRDLRDLPDALAEEGCPA
jgi:putative hydrolase of the HAD superfamily